ncbi:MAG: hypothetical protein AVDCRST_MAG77-3741 [uncultured Chloroflexi bacterium]|uniref:Uncharacterized protein n=1 Tax=uncultured Chloroflexota bacterium TaxID=166587 RepID=A0A6J4J135_9CHLR|nr:MAG: hypothetical protein AVDCRST_MAG77-3741 [uncultured Chloroflexota bacterium]
MTGSGTIGSEREPGGGGAVPQSTGAADVTHTSDTSGGSSAIGRASAGLTGLGADSASSGDSLQGGQTERTTLGDAQGTQGAGLNLGLGSGAAGGLGMHGDTEARLRAEVTGPSGGAAGSATPHGVEQAGSADGAAGGLGGGLGGPSGAGAGTVRARGADGHESGAGLRGTGAMNDDRADETGASPEAQDGTTTAAHGGSIIDRVTTGQGGDVGGGLTGPG